MNAQQTAPAGTAQDVRDIFDELAAADHMTLMRVNPECVFYTAYEGVRRRAEWEIAADADDVERCIEDTFPLPFISVYGPDGRKAFLRDHEDGWLDELFEGVSQRFRTQWKYNPNAVDRSGDYLLVSQGQWVPVASQVIDGERTFEFITVGEALRIEAAKEDEWETAYRAQHPEIDASRPAWATRSEIWHEKLDDDRRVQYTRSFTHLTLQQLATHRGGVVELLDEPTGYIASNDVTPEQMLTLAAELTEASAALAGSLDKRKA